MKTNDRLIELVKKIKVGDNAAFTDLYNESYKYLHTCVIHIVKDEDIAQDMLQDAYVEIYKNIGQLKDDEGFLGWAATIANRKCFAYLKKNKDLLVDEQKDDEGNETDYFESIADDEAFIPENILDNQEKIKIIRGIIDDLTDVQRACVIGFYYNEQKQDEIANELGLPVNTVKSHLNRAKAKIKEAVGDTERKQGIKLYSIAPFMLLFFLKDAEVYAAELAVPAMSAGLSSAVSGSTAASGTVATGAKAAGMAIKTKVIAGIVAGAVVVGGITGVALHKAKPVEPEVIEEVAGEPVVEVTEITEELDNHVDVTINIDDILNQISLDGTQISNMTYEQFSSMEGAVESRNEDDTLFGYGRFGNGIHLLWEEDGNIQVMDGRGALVNDNIDDVFKSWTITADAFLNNYLDGLYNNVLDEGTVFFNNGQMIFRMFPNGQRQICLYFDDAGTFGMNCIYINMKEDDAKVFSYGFEKTDVSQEGKPLSEYEIVPKDEASIVEESTQSDLDFWTRNGLFAYENDEITVPYMFEFKDKETGEPLGTELGGTSIVKNGDNNIRITSAEVTIDGGYKDITIIYQATIKAYFLYDSPDATYNYSTKKAFVSPEVFDKYTGLIMKTEGDRKGSGVKNDTVTDVEYGDNVYQVKYVVDNSWDSGWDDYLPYSESLNIPQCYEYQEYNSVLTSTLRFRVPEDYDGLVIAFAKKGADRFARTDKEQDDTLHYMFEPDRYGECLGADDYYYFPISELLEKTN